MERTASRIAQVDHEGVPGLFDGNEALALLRLSTQTPQGRSHRTLADERRDLGRFLLRPRLTMINLPPSALAAAS